nr:uncharacterized protein LOC109119463 [Solanum lycopersicum]
MGKEFEMSMMGELTFFLGLQIKQSSNGISISQEKYIKELLKKFNMFDSKPIDTLMGTNSKLIADESDSLVNHTMYRGIIGFLLYLTASRLDIVYSVGMYADFAGFQVDKKSTSGMSHFLGSSLISWGTKKQNSIALSTAEAEYVAAAAVVHNCYGASNN